MSKAVAIVGTCNSSRMLAPYKSPDVDIWACGPDNTHGDIPRITRFFEIHGDLGLPGEEWWHQTYIDWLKAQSEAGAFELVAHDHRLFPKATILPKDALLKQFGPRWFTSTPAWMIGLALLEGYKTIFIYGIDASSREEYLWQRPGLHRMIEWATDVFKVDVIVPMESDLLQPAPLYGYDLSSPFGRKLEVRRKELLGRIGQARRVVAEQNEIIAHLTGALDDLDYVQSIWTGEGSLAASKPVRTEETLGNVVPIRAEEH